MFAVEVWNIGAFAEVFGAEGDHALAADGAEPGVGGRVAVQDGDEGGVSGEGGEDGFDVGAGGSVAFAAGAGGGGPAGVEAVGAGDGEEAGAGGFGQEFGEGGFGFRRDGALVGQGDAGAGGGVTQWAPAMTWAGSRVRGFCSRARVERRSQTAEPSGFCIWAKAWRRRMASSST